METYRMNKTSTLVAAITLLSFSLLGQQTPPTGKPEIAQFFYNGAGDVQYICFSPQRKVTATSVTRTATSLTSIGVSSNTATATTSAAHGLYVGARVVVSGATVVAALNGTYTILTVPSTTTYTFTTAGVANATYNESTLQVGTYYPLLSEYLWAIQVFTYNATPSVSGVFWAGSVVSYTLACSDRASY